jgi:poly-gamma-glutamate synthesis protein (capsule biosynthesis protein)
MKEKKKDFEISREMHRTIRLVAILLVLALVFFTGHAAIRFCLSLFADGDYIVQLPGQDSPIVSLSDSSKPTEPVYIDPSQVVEIARADFAVAGDVMLHMPIIRTSQTADGYNFDDIFKYIKPYITRADFAAANLETTLAGSDGKEFTGFPNFNSPDAIALSAKNAGLDMLLTGNEHSYDYGTAGLKRTLSILKSYNLTALGTVEHKEETRHVIKTAGGVKVGMVCYTFASIDESNNVTINNLTTDSAAAGLINAFDYSRLSQFYTEVEGEVSTMEANGVDITMVFIHWGDEYSLKVSDKQKEIAQKLCDLGIDVIVGSHPHVVQPIDLLTSSVNPAHKVVCLYSMGNFLSNQRADNIGITSGHSEDGLLLNFTFSKYNDGTARISAISALPTWVLVQGTDDDRDFYIVPLDQTVTDWRGAYLLSSDQLSASKNSYNRTMAIITPGLNKVTSYLAEKNSLLNPTIGIG